MERVSRGAAQPTIRGQAAPFDMVSALLQPAKEHIFPKPHLSTQSEPPFHYGLLEMLSNVPYGLNKLGGGLWIPTQDATLKANIMSSPKSEHILCCSMLRFGSSTKMR
jgi:hypothetical protein